jgi:PAS domain-containing protein
MTSDFDIGKITEAFAAAAIDSSRWTSVVDMVSAATGSLGAVIFPNRGALPYIPVCASMFETFDIYVRDGWIDNDERNHGIPLLLEKGVITDLDIWPQEHIQRSAYYQDYLAHRCGLHSFAAVRVGRGENIWALSIQRTEAQGPFSHSELRSLAQLSQNLNSIADTASALAFARGEGALAAFDMAEKAAFLLDRRGDVVRANQAAEALLGDDVFISRRRLSSRSPQATGAFDATIKALLWNNAASSAPSLVFPRERPAAAVGSRHPLSGNFRIRAVLLPRSRGDGGRRKPFPSGRANASGGFRPDRLGGAACRRDAGGKRFAIGGAEARRVARDDAQASESDFRQNRRAQTVRPGRHAGRSSAGIERRAENNEDWGGGGSVTAGHSDSAGRENARFHFS